jgi:hypothetical protein
MGLFKEIFADVWLQPAHSTRVLRNGYGRGTGELHISLAEKLSSPIHENPGLPHEIYKSYLQDGSRSAISKDNGMCLEKFVKNDFDVIDAYG